MIIMAKKEYRVYTRWLAYELRQLGFTILRTEVNEYHPQFDVYVFEDTSALHQKIVELSAARRIQQGG